MAAIPYVSGADIAATLPPAEAIKLLADLIIPRDGIACAEYVRMFGVNRFQRGQREGG